MAVAGGNIHHYGYSMRGLFVAYFLMKDVLREAGKLEEAVRTLNWYAITNEVYPEPAVNGIDIDTFNTKLQGRIASILIMEDTPEKLQYLRSFSRCWTKAAFLRRDWPVLSSRTVLASIIATIILPMQWAVWTVPLI